MTHLKFIRNLLQYEAERLQTGIIYRVEETYLDYGADIKLINVIAYPRDGMQWQVFSPRELNEINVGIYTNKQLMRLVDNHSSNSK